MGNQASQGGGGGALGAVGAAAVGAVTYVGSAAFGAVGAVGNVAFGAAGLVGSVGVDLVTGAVRQAERQLQLAVGPDEGYINALQKFTPIATPHHRALAPKKLVPAPKPLPPPPSIIEDWSTTQLCNFIEACFVTAYGSQFAHHEEVLSNFRQHLIDGSRVKHLDDDDWQQLCPYSGPRSLVVEQLKSAAPTAAAVKPVLLSKPTPSLDTSPAPPSPPRDASPATAPTTAPEPALSDLQQILAKLPTINAEAEPATASAGHTTFKPPPKPKEPKTKDEGHGLLYEDLSEGDSMSMASPMSPLSVDEAHFPADSTLPSASPTPSQPPQQALPEAMGVQVQLPAKQRVSWKMLLERSKFSNHRLIDTQWQPDRSRNWIIQIGQILFYEVMRVLFTLYIFRKFALRGRQVPYFCIPLCAMFVCLQQGWLMDFSPTLFTNIVVFPLAFALNAAYQRREIALQTLASIKSSALAIHLFGESWVGTQLELPQSYVLDSARIIRAIFRTMGHYLTAINEDDKEVLLHNVFDQFTDLFHHIDLIRLSGLPPPLITVPFNNAINMMTGFERLRNFSDYRTPCTMRSYSKACMGVLSFAMAPFFARISSKWGVPYGYILCLAFFWLLVCMDNIQAMLENPFITFGRMNAEDDINLSSMKGVVLSKKAKRRLRKLVAAAAAQQKEQGAAAGTT